MNRRRATQPELQALTTTAGSLAILAATWTPGLITPAITAVLTYLAVVVGAAKLLRWELPHTLHASNLTLRHTLATLIRAIAFILQTLLLLLSTAHTHLTTGYTTAA